MAGLSYAGGLRVVGSRLVASITSRSENDTDTRFRTQACIDHGIVGPSIAPTVFGLVMMRFLPGADASTTRRSSSCTPQPLER
jgi:hypothetical protein